MVKGKKEEKKMDFYRKTAIIVGALFIIATATTMVSIIFMGSSLEDNPVDFAKVADNDNGIIISVIFWIILAVSVTGIGFFMYPILKKYDQGLALGYLAFRLIETVLILVAAISLQSLLTLSQEYITRTTDVTYYESSGTLLKALFDWSFIIGTMIFLGLGGLVLNYILYQLKLVPRWLSGWGFIGAACVLLYGLTSLFDYDPAILSAPIAIQEMIFAVWLIVKGFDTSVIDSQEGQK